MFVIFVYGNVGEKNKVEGGQLADQDVLLLFTNPSAQARYDTRSIFKRSLTGLNSKFSFS